MAITSCRGSKFHTFLVSKQEKVTWEASLGDGIATTQKSITSYRLSWELVSLDVVYAIVALSVESWRAGVEELLLSLQSIIDLLSGAVGMRESQTCR